MAVMVGTERFKVLKFGKGDYIMEEGDEGDFVVIISSGEADIVRLTKGKEEKIGTVKVGQIVGEMAVIDHPFRDHRNRLAFSQRRTDDPATGSYSG